MRTRFIALLFLGAAASTAGADDRISAFVSDVAHGTGAAYSHAWSPRWSTELSAAVERRNARIAVFPTSGQPFTEVAKVRSYPIDLMMSYHFLNESRWSPYVSAGVHYIRAPSGVLRYPNSIFPLPVSSGRPYDNRTSAQFGGGVTFAITPHLGLRFDLKQQLGTETVPFDSLTRGSVGLSWRF